MRASNEVVRCVVDAVMEGWVPNGFPPGDLPLRVADGLRNAETLAPVDHVEREHMLAEAWRKAEERADELATRLELALTWARLRIEQPQMRDLLTILGHSE